MIAYAAAINQLDINTITLSILVWSSVVSGYGFCLALPYGAWVGHRGLAVGETVKSNVVYVGNMVGAWGSLVSILALIFGCVESMNIFS